MVAFPLQGQRHWWQQRPRDLQSGTIQYFYVKKFVESCFTTLGSLFSTPLYQTGHQGTGHREVACLRSHSLAGTSTLSTVGLRLDFNHFTPLPSQPGPWDPLLKLNSQFLKSEEQRHCYGGSTSRCHNIFRGTGDVIREGNAIRPEFSIFPFVVTTKWGLWQLARKGGSAETSWHGNSPQSRGYCCYKACCKGRVRGRCMVDASARNWVRPRVRLMQTFAFLCQRMKKIAWHGGSCL